MKYVSRRYLKEKWDALKWDMEKTLDVNNERTDDDSVDEDTVRRVAGTIHLMCHSIVKELGEIE